MASFMKRPSSASSEEDSSLNQKKTTESPMTMVECWRLPYLLVVGIMMEEIHTSSINLLLGAKQKKQQGSITKMLGHWSRTNYWPLVNSSVIGHNATTKIGHWSILVKQKLKTSQLSTRGAWCRRHISSAADVKSEEEETAQRSSLHPNVVYV
jgi:hypothetical protein